MAIGHETPSQTTGWSLGKSPWLQLAVGVVALPAMVGAAGILFILIYGIEGRGNFLVFFTITSAVFGFLFPRWWAIPYAGGLNYLYGAIKYAGEEAPIYYTYDRSDWVIVGALGAAVGVGARLVWNLRQRRT